MHAIGIFRYAFTADAIPNKKAKKWVGIPTDALIHEGDFLFAWTQKDKEKLEKAGLDWNLVEDIQCRCLICRELCAEWNSIRYSDNDITTCLISVFNSSEIMVKATYVGVSTRFDRSKILKIHARTEPLRGI